MRLAKYFGMTLSIAVALAFTFNGVRAQDARAADSQDLQQRVLALSSPSGRQIGSAHIAAVPFIKDFYAARNYRPAWTSPDSVVALQQAITNSWRDGLQSADFHAVSLGIEPSRDVEQITAVERDIIQTDAFVRLLYQLYFGKVDPVKVDPNWNFQRRLPNGEALSIISNAIENGEVAELTAFARPKDARYDQLRRLLVRMVGHLRAGGWPRIPQGGTLKLGDSDARVTVLRRRLSITGEFGPNAQSETPEIYDPALQQAVQKFQTLNGIDADGVVGPATVAALNVSAQQRVDQIRVNMERSRWILPALQGQRDLVVVNAAGFYLWLFLDGQFVWGTEVITGKPYHKTPVFTEMMTYVVLNPDWTVPRSILRNEIFPKAKADPSYLAAKNYDLVSSNGDKVSPTSLDWTTLTAKQFPYRVVQRPGPRNALGLVKFIFPNRFNVYLHDTPSRQLFSKTGRAFSHGCIRVKDPLKFAELVFGQRNGWSRETIDQVIASGKQRRVNLKKPLKVAILYWTVDPGRDGEIYFYKDIYGRDAKLLKALNSEFKFK